MYGPPTIDPPPPAPEQARASRRRKIIATAVSVVGALLAAVVLAGFLVRLPYVIISPGEATPLDRSVVSIEGAETYEHRGNVLFLTVRVTNRDPTAWRLFFAWLDPDQDIEDRDTVEGCLSAGESASLNTALMAQSQDVAKKVALTRLGYDVPADPPKVAVVEACEGTPAHDKVEVGDVVLAVDGTPVTSVSAIGSMVRAHQPGDAITLTVSRAGETVTVRVVAGHFSAKGTKCVPEGAGDRPGRGRADGAGAAGADVACLGVASQEITSYHFPITVHIDTRRVGGPSAGLAFALAIIDDLTPGDLTGGRRVAVTGTIGPDGSVGPVGGVTQKAITARERGASTMIVPESEVDDARKGAGDMPVVGVKDLDGALAAFARNGGSEVPPAPSTAARS